MPDIAGAAIGGIASGIFGGDDRDAAIQQLSNRRDTFIPFTAGGLRADLQGDRIVVGPSGGGGGLRLPQGARVQNGRVVRDVGGGPIGNLRPGGMASSDINNPISRMVLRTAGLEDRFGVGGSRTVDLGPVENFRSPGGTPPRQQLVDRLSGVFGTQGERLENLLPTVRPGFSEFREAGLNQIGDRARRTTGNLRQNLANRRVLGSSFGQSAIDRTQREFAREEANFAAKSFLQELDTTTKLIGEVASARSQEVETLLNELDTQLGIGVELATGARSEFGANARMKAKLAAESARGMGAFGAELGGSIGDAIGQIDFGGSSSGGGGFTQSSALGLSPSNLFG